MSAVEEAVRKKLRPPIDVSGFRKRITVRVDAWTLFRLEVLSQRLRDSKTGLAEDLLAAAAKDALSAAGVNEGLEDYQLALGEFLCEHVLGAEPEEPDVEAQVEEHEELVQLAEIVDHPDFVVPGLVESGVS